MQGLDDSPGGEPWLLRVIMLFVIILINVTYKCIQAGLRYG